MLHYSRIPSGTSETGTALDTNGPVCEGTKQGAVYPIPYIPYRENIRKGKHIKFHSIQKSGARRLTGEDYAMIRKTVVLLLILAAGICVYQGSSPLYRGAQWNRSI